MIIDAHVHIHPDPKGFGKLYDASLKNLTEQLKTVPLNKIILLPIAPEISNAFVADACRKEPDRLVAAASIDFRTENDAVEKFEEDVLKYNLKGFKIHPRRQKINTDDLPLLLKLVEKSSAKELPVVIDAFQDREEIFGEGVNSLELIDYLAIKLPQAKLVIAHAGAFKVFDAMMIAKAHSNVFLDISVSLLYFKGSSVVKDLGYGIKKLGSKKWMYGSDFPQYNLKTSLNEAVKFLEELRIKDKEKTDILGNNAKELFKL